MKKITAMISALALLLTMLCAVPVYADELPVFEDPVYDIETDAYTVVTDETGTKLTTATAGTVLYFSTDPNVSLPTDKYFTDAFLVDGTETVTYEYTMPARNISVTAVLAERVDYTLDISDGTVKNLPYSVYLFSTDVLPVCDGDNTDPSVTLLDFNKNGTADAKITMIEPATVGDDPTYTIQLLKDAVGQLPLTYSVNLEFGPYKSVSFTLNSESVGAYYTVIANADKGGKADGGALLLKGVEAHLSAKPDKGYAFDGWYEDGIKVSSMPEYKFTVSRNISLTARFRLIVNRISVSNTTVIYNNSKKITVTVYDIYSKAMAGEAVTITINGKKTTTKTNDFGEAYFTPSGIFKPKTYTVSVSCGDVTVNAKYIVKKATPKLTAKAKSFKKETKTKKYSVTLKDNKNNAIKKTKVTLKVKGKTYTAKTNSKGKATFKITKLTKKGTFNATVKFAGNGYYNAVSKKVKIKVK